LTLCYIDVAKPNDNILFFDGVCTLCNRFVDFLIRVDKKEKLRFASLQGKTAERLLPLHLREKKDSIVYLKDSNFHLRSSGSLRAIKEVGGIYSALFVFIIVPRFVRDWFYKQIAKNRYKWFGKRETCRVPDKSEEDRILE